MLGKYTNEDPPKPAEASEGTSFSNVGEEADPRAYDKEFWKHKTCRACGKTGHPSWSHTQEEKKQLKKAQEKKKKKNDKKEKKSKEEPKSSDDDSVGSSRSKWSSVSKSSTKSVQKLINALVADRLDSLTEQLKEDDEYDDDYTH